MNIKKEISVVIVCVVLGLILSSIFNGFKEINITIIYLLHQWKDKYPDSFEHFQKKYGKKKIKKKKTDKQKLIDSYKNKIKIVDVSQIENTISKHEKVIMKYDKSKHHDLIRLSKFIKNVETKIKERFEWGTSTENIYQSELLSYVNLEKNTKNLDLLVKLNITMINKLVEDKITDFLIIYEKFEEIGAFRNSFENELLNKLDQLTDKLDNISNQLRKIDSRLGYQNLVLTYNAYQFNQIRKSLKK